MHFYMPFKISSLLKCLATFILLIWFLPVCVLIYLVKEFQSEKDFIQKMDTLIWFLFSMCLRWITKLHFCEKDLSQWLHWNGFSSVCVLRWITKLYFCEKVLSQWLHWNGLPQYVFSCLLRLDFIKKMDTLIWFLFSMYP